MADQEMTEWRKEWAQSREELAESMRRLAESQRELSESHKETERVLRETAEKTARESQETDQQLKELGKQLGGLGDKFGSFTEGLALPSMTKILTRDFRMSGIAPRVRVRDNGHSMEVDVLAWSKDPAGDAVVVEVKSHLREEGLEQMRRILREFRDFFPEHASRKLYGILAVVDAPDDLREKVLREGIYLASIHDGQFELQVPEDFKAQAY